MPVDDDFRVFLSYSHKDRRIAGEIKRHLEGYGLFVFLAHDDIAPSIIWQDEILKQLIDCHVFVPLLSTNFKDSKWTDQEAGIAYGHEKEIIPVCLDETSPYGFMGKYQGFNCNSDAPRTSKIIMDTILSKPIGGLLKYKMIGAYLDSHSWEGAATRAEVLYDNMPYDEKQINAIIYGIITNEEIYTSFDGRRTVSSIIEKHGEIEDRVLLNYFETLKESGWDGDIFVETWGEPLESLIMDYIVSKKPDYDRELVHTLMEHEKSDTEYMSNDEALYRVMRDHGIM